MGSLPIWRYCHYHGDCRTFCICPARSEIDCTAVAAAGVAIHNVVTKLVITYMVFRILIYGSIYPYNDDVILRLYYYAIACSSLSTTGLGSYIRRTKNKTRILGMYGRTCSSYRHLHVPELAHLGYCMKLHNYGNSIQPNSVTVRSMRSIIGIIIISYDGYSTIYHKGKVRQRK